MHCMDGDDTSVRAYVFPNRLVSKTQIEKNQLGIDHYKRYGFNIHFFHKDHVI